MALFLGVAQTSKDGAINVLAPRFEHLQDRFSLKSKESKQNILKILTG